MRQSTLPKMSVLRLAVPRNNDRGPAAFEQILAALHGLLSENHKHQRNETVSFEFISLGDSISIYVVVPRHLRTFLRSQLYAQYPNVELEEIDDYLSRSLLSGKEALAAELRPVDAPVYPFKRHPQFEDRHSESGFEDPFSAMAESLCGLDSETDCAAIQFVFEPIDPGWNIAAKKSLPLFSKRGVWKWRWFRRFYSAIRLDCRKSTRFAKSPLWGLILLLFGWVGVDWRNGASSSIRSDESGERDSHTSQHHDRETVGSAAFDKVCRLCFNTNIRMVYFHSDPDHLHAESKIREMAGAFQQFSLPQMNHFCVKQNDQRSSNRIIRNLASRSLNRPFALSQEELATMVHLPTSGVATPGMKWVDSQKLEPPKTMPRGGDRNVTLIGETNFREQRLPYGLLPDDRRRHVYIIGKTGMGKSTLLENMILSDIADGRGVAVIDPHGDLADAALRLVPKHRTNDVVLINPSDTDFPIALNLLEVKDVEQRALVASGLVGVIKKLNIDSWGPRLEHFLRNTILALIEAPDTTLLGISRILVDQDYRRSVLKHVKDPMVRAFWETEFTALSPTKLAEAVSPIQNKVGQFLSTPTIRNIVGQPKSTLDMRFAMDSGKIIIVNLSKGKIGEDISSMLGSLLITKFQIDAMSRADTPAEDRRDFYLYVDEFQNFATDSFATILSEARKYKLNLTMANQYIAQMSDEVAAAVFGNVGTLVSFQVGFEDARTLAGQFDEERIQPIDLASLPKYQVFNRIMVSGMTTPVFSGNTLPPPTTPSSSAELDRTHLLINASRQRYARPREVVEDKISRWSGGVRRKKIA